MDEEKLAAFRLIRSENIGARTFHQMLKLYGSAKTALSKASEFSKNGGPKNITLCSEEDAKTEIEKIHKFNAELIYFKDDIYPKLLKKVQACPPFLTIKGDSSLLARDMISIVGSRNASINGLRFTQNISKEISVRGNHVIVSGLARGIDTEAHKASLENGTIAVISGGIDVIYPLENTDLYNRISETGLLMTESPFGMHPKAQHFPQRNRIIAALSIATIVMEAGMKSGSLITANFALEQNRDVFAVPGFPLDIRYKGNNYLIKQGAYLMESADDVLENINSDFQKMQLELMSADASCHVADIEEKLQSNDIEQIKNVILSKINASPVLIDNLVRDLNIPVDIVMVALVELELSQKIHRVGNSSIVLIS